MTTSSSTVLLPCPSPPAAAPDVYGTPGSSGPDTANSDSPSFDTALELARANSASESARAQQSRGEPAVRAERRPDPETSSDPETDSTAPVSDTGASHDVRPTSELKQPDAQSNDASTAPAREKTSRTPKKREVSAQETAGLIAAASIVTPASAASAAIVQPPDAGTTIEGFAVVASAQTVLTASPLNPSAAPMDSQSGATAGSGVGKAAAAPLTQNGPVPLATLPASAAPPDMVPAGPKSLGPTGPNVTTAPISTQPQAAASASSVAGLTSIEAAAASPSAGSTTALTQAAVITKTNAKNEPVAVDNKAGVKKLDGIDRLLVVKEHSATRAAEAVSGATQMSPTPSTDTVQSRLATSTLAPNPKSALPPIMAVTKAAGISTAAAGSANTAETGSPLVTQPSAPAIQNGILTGTEAFSAASPLNAAAKVSAALASSPKETAPASPGLAETSAVNTAISPIASGEASGGASSGSHGDAPTDQQSAQAPATPVGGLSGAANATGPTPLSDTASPTVSAQTTSSAAPVDRSHIAEQISKHLDSVQLTDGRGEMTLRLSPDHLGSLHLTISTSEHGVTARIVVETAQAQQAVEGSKDQLRQALENRGMNLTSLDVSLNQNGAGGGAQTFAEQQQQAKEFADRASNRAYGRSDTNVVPEMTVPSAVRNGISSNSASRLDYRA